MLVQLVQFAPNRGRPLGNDLTLALHLYFCRGKAQKDLTNAVEWPTLIGRSAIPFMLDGTRSHVLVLLDPFARAECLNGQEMASCHHVHQTNPCGGVKSALGPICSCDGRIDCAPCVQHDKGGGPIFFQSDVVPVPSSPQSPHTS